MIPFGLSIVLHSPTLLAATPPASNLTETLPFIPGNTIRGALGHRYLDLGGSADDRRFRSLFLSGAVHFGCAYVDGAHPLPLSVRSCKYDGGFRGDNGHGVIDLLLAGTAERQCPEEGCEQAIDYFQGFWDPQRQCKVSVSTRLITRTAIDPRRGTARTGQLFSQCVLEEGQTFRAILEVPEAMVQEVQQLLQQPYTARLGTGTSRGQGWVEIRREEPLAVSWDTAAERFDRFASKELKPFAIVTLLSDAMFQDDYLRDSTAPSSADLHALGLDPEEWCSPPSQAYMDTRTVFGFDGAPIYLPRQPRLAVVAGSVFLFEARRSEARPTLPAGDGLGWVGTNTSEGYGRAMLWYPFHLHPDPQGVTG